MVVAALIACASLAIAQPKFESASPTAGGKTSQQANTTADKTVYQAVEYSNKNVKGPMLVVIPGEIKSSNATFLQKFTANNIADFGELELSNANFQVLERSQPGPGTAMSSSWPTTWAIRRLRASTSAWAS